MAVLPIPAVLAPLLALWPVAAAGGAAAPTPARAIAPGPDALVAAYDRGDLDEVARLGERLGAAGLEPMLRGPHADAAITAAAAAPDGWELLGPLAEVAGGWDRARAAPAARTAARLAGALGDAAARDLPDDALAAAEDAWAALATRPDRWADVRVHALDAAAHLARARGDAGGGYDLAAALADADPEVRRAAAELVVAPAPASARAPLAARVAGDDEPAVALAAAQALCGDLAFGDDAAPVLAALGDAGLVRLRAIAKAPPDDASIPALVDAARCLAADGAPDSVAALRALAAKGPRALRGPIGELLGK